MKIGIEIDRTIKVSPKCMSANADSVCFKLVCNVRVWAYVSGKKFFFTKNSQWSWAGHFLYQISCSQRLRGIVQMMKKERTFWIVSDIL